MPLLAPHPPARLRICGKTARLAGTLCGWRVRAADDQPHANEQSAFSSVLEDEPADRVAPGLISEHKYPNLLVESIALRVAFDASGAGVAWLRCSRGLDCVGGGAEIMLGHVAYASCLTGGIGGIPRSPRQGAGRTHRVSTACPGVHHLHIPTSPRSRRVDRVPWASIRRLAVLEEMQYVFRALGRPQRQQLMIRICKRPATADRDQARVADLGEYHAISVPVVLAE